MKIKKGLLGDMTASLSLGLGQEIWKISVEFWNTVSESKEELKMHMYTQPYKHKHTIHIPQGTVRVCHRDRELPMAKARRV